MASGKFSLLTVLSLSAAGYDQGINKAKQSTKDFTKGVESANKSVKQSFSGIGNVAGGLGSQLNTSLGGLPSMLGGALSGFRSMIPAITSVKTALISSGIGAIVVLIGLAFSALTTYLTGTSEGAMKVKEMFGYITGAATVLINRLKSLGKALFSILTGDVEGFKAAMAEAFKGGFIDEVVAGAKEGNALAKETNRLKIEKNKLDSEELDVLLKQAELTKQAKDVTKESNYSAAQRLAFEKEAVRIGDEFDAKKMKHLKDAWNLEVNLNKQKTQLNQSDIEKEIAAKKAYFDYVIKDNQDAISENKIIAKTQKEIDSDAMDAAKERIRLEKQLQTEKMITLKITPDNLNLKKIGKKVTNKKDFEGDKLTKFAEDKVSEATTDQNLLEIPSLDPALTGFSKLKNVMGVVGTAGTELNNTFNTIGETVGNLGAIFGEQTVAYKAFAIAQATINTFLGASQVIADAKVPTFLKPFLVGSIIALGLAQVAKISGAFANGGIVGGASFSGDQVTARVNSGEMILNRTQQANLFSLANGSGNNYGGGEYTLRVQGTDLIYVMNKLNRKNNLIR